MKNLLNDAVNEMVVRVNDEVIDMRNEVKEADTVGHKIQIVERRQAKINRLFKKLNNLKEHAVILYAEDFEDRLNELDKFERNIRIQVEDMFFIANEMF